MFTSKCLRLPAMIDGGHISHSKMLSLSSILQSDFEQSCKGNYNYKQCPECLG